MARSSLVGLFADPELQDPSDRRDGDVYPGRVPMDEPFAEHRGLDYRRGVEAPVLQPAHRRRPWRPSPMPRSPARHPRGARTLSLSSPSARPLSPGTSRGRASLRGEGRSRRGGTGRGRSRPSGLDALDASALVFWLRDAARASAPWTTKCSPVMITFPGASATTFRTAHPNVTEG